MNKLSGVISAMPTPILENEDIDVAGLRNLIDYIIESGVSGIFVLGSMGEGPALISEQQKKLVENSVKYIDGRIPVLVSINEVSARRAVETAKVMEDLSSDYFVTSGPFFYSHPNQKSVVEYVEHVINNISKPTFFYDCPNRTGNPISIETLETILKIPGIVGVKDSSCNFNRFAELMRRYPDKQSRPFSYFYADESMFDMCLMLGADGIISGGGTLFISDLVELYEVSMKKDLRKAMEIQKLFRLKMDNMLGQTPAVDWMYAVKKELKKNGICEPNVTKPFFKREILKH
jgi:4-hydroxy-tetrahydrodipicolinate synthase